MKEACKLLSLDYKKIKSKYRFITILGLIGSLVANFLLQSTHGLIFLIFMLLYIYMDQQSILSRADKYRLAKQQEFVNFVSYIVVFLENKFNVYQALKICIPYLDKCLQNDVENFVNQIDNDKTIVPYVDIAKRIGTSLVMQMMVMLYQMNKSGYDAKYLTKFPFLIEKAHDLFMKERIQKKRSEMGIYSMIPIVALMIVVFVMVFSIIGMVGGGVV